MGIVGISCVLVVGVAALTYGWTEFARARPALKGWHLQAPASEFRAADAKSNYTFDDYLKQEDKVFTELAALMDGPWAREHAIKFCRFRAESVCNPETIMDRNWNRTFVFESPDPVGGALLLHGLSDSPYSLRRIGERLHEEGYTVIGLRVPGHGTCPGAVAKASWEDWAAAVKVAVRGLRDRLPEDTPLVLAGFSNGGALSVDYAICAADDESLPRPDSLALFSPMIGITPMAKLTRFYGPMTWISREDRAAWSAVNAEIDPFKYSSWPMNASVQAWQMTQRVSEGLDRLQEAGRMGELPPVLAMQSVVDATVVVPVLIASLFDRLEPNAHELVLFDINRVGWLENVVDVSFEHEVLPRLKRTDLPFKLTLVTNANAESYEVVARTRDGEKWDDTAIGLSWPEDVFSLSHGAVPIPSDDPILGTAEATAKTGLPLGSLTLRGEQGVLLISDGMIIRLRHNPFYDYMEEHVVTWLASTVGQSGSDRLASDSGADEQ